MKKIRITIWNEFIHEKKAEAVAKLYPEGIHGALAKGLGSNPLFEIRTATLSEPEHGLTDEVLDNTDVLFWWGHVGHKEVSDEVAERVQKRVLGGMGFVALHSAHMSKPFMRLMGTSCDLKWRESGDRERIWVIEPSHPIANGLPEYIEIPEVETYGERFDIPAPDELVFISWFSGGEVFRSGCCYRRGLGKIFYFKPGHETYPIFYMEDVLKVLDNAARWAAPENGPRPTMGQFQSLENK